MAGGLVLLVLRLRIFTFFTSSLDSRLCRGYDNGKNMRGRDRVKVLIVSDVESSYIWEHFSRERFKDIELVISCGDLKASYLQFIVTMLGVPVFYIHGNHDTRYLEAPPRGCDCIEDNVFIYGGYRIAGLGGSPEYSGGPFQFTEQDMRKRCKRLSRKIRKHGGIDILVTHAPAYHLGDGTDFAHVGFKVFRQLLDDWTPRFHFHGHQHLSYSHTTKRTITYGKTQIVNAHHYHIVEI